MPAAVDSSAVQALRDRLKQPGAVALVGVEEDRPVVGCVATQAVEDGEPLAGRAHVSGIAAAPDRWGRGLAHALLIRLEDLLVQHGYDVAQLYVLETNTRARSVYEHLGWRLVRKGEPHPEGPQAVYEKKIGHRA